MLPEDASKATPIVIDIPPLAATICRKFVLKLSDLMAPQDQLCSEKTGISIGLYKLSATPTIQQYPVVETSQ